MQLITVRIDKPEAINFILGQTHFIKSVEDMHEALPVRRRPQLARMQATNAASRSRYFIFVLPELAARRGSGG